MGNQELDFRGYYLFARNQGLGHGEAVSETERRYHLDDVARSVMLEINHSQFGGGLVPPPLVFSKPRPEFSDEELETIENYIGYHSDVLSGSDARRAAADTDPIREKIRAYLGE